jgi:hypothetical protein
MPAPTPAVSLPREEGDDGEVDGLRFFSSSPSLLLGLTAVFGVPAAVAAAAAAAASASAAARLASRSAASCVTAAVAA